MHVHIRGQKQTHNYVNINILTLKEAIQMNINKFLASGRKSISSLRQKHGPIEYSKTLLKQLSRAYLIRDETAKKSWERDKNEGTQ